MTPAMKAAEEALQPFAEQAKKTSASAQNWRMVAGNFSVGHCRAAADALALIRAEAAAVPADRKPWFQDEATAAFGSAVPVDRNALARRLVAFADANLANDDADLIMEAAAFIRLPAAVLADRDP